MQKLFIISNESIFDYEGNFFCDNIDMKSTPEGLKNQFDVNIIARKSKKKRSHKINLKYVICCRNIFSFILQIIQTFKEDKVKYLIISVSPYTTIAALIIRIFRRSSSVYLRSDGYGEYKAIFGIIGPSLYHIMFFLVEKSANLISCRDYILKGKDGKIIEPSQLSNRWLENTKKADLRDINLLYVGRIRIEKGIYSLLNILKDINYEFNLSIIGAEKNLKHLVEQKNVKVIEIENNEDKLINFYDQSNIFILPSFTEGHPMVLLESLSRLRPVIIFDDIKHVIGKKKGIFVAQRNSSSLSDVINYIIDNYSKIQEEMKKNNLPTKKNFLEKISVLIKNN